MVPKGAVFIPCFVDQLAPQAGLDMARVLRRIGCEEEYRPEQTCCGQPAFNTGYWQDARELRRMAPAWPGGRSLRWSSEGAPNEASQATITLAEALVASTGSALVSASCGGRGASVVAPCHIVNARLEQLVPDMDAALARAQESGAVSRNSFLGLITGSSRTADIEKILVMGAHGPRRLVVV